MKKIIGCWALLLAACLPATAQTQAPVRVNCGGPSYTDSKGNVWQADFGFTEGMTETNSNPVTGTPDPALFGTYRCSERAISGES